ncbi:UNKNOWN [Stylonychia lemnae]|uniref:Uncharacterized protein n=1 Tax=Stylonychia lemnae TaxID=5949 RepID=A0A078AQ21_STYLE|nr:UNKNOWN [Stylonychia lemnae]|eukprot:CDW84066.1 UNKNOWN [Stylonychia lemnae]
MIKITLEDNSSFEINKIENKNGRILDENKDKIKIPMSQTFFLNHEKQVQKEKVKYFQDELNEGQVIIIANDLGQQPFQNKQTQSQQIQKDSTSNNSSTTQKQNSQKQQFNESAGSIEDLKNQDNLLEDYIQIEDYHYQNTADNNDILEIQESFALNERIKAQIKMKVPHQQKFDSLLDQKNNL